MLWIYGAMMVLIDKMLRCFWTGSIPKSCLILNFFHINFFVFKEKLFKNKFIITNKHKIFLPFFQPLKPFQFAEGNFCWSLCPNKIYMPGNLNLYYKVFTQVNNKLLNLEIKKRLYTIVTGYPFKLKVCVIMVQRLI